MSSNGSVPKKSYRLFPSVNGEVDENDPSNFHDQDSNWHDGMDYNKEFADDLRCRKDVVPCVGEMGPASNPMDDVPSGMEPNDPNTNVNEENAIQSVDSPHDQENSRDSDCSSGPVSSASNPTLEGQQDVNISPPGPSTSVDEIQTPIDLKMPEVPYLDLICLAVKNSSEGMTVQEICLYLCYHFPFLRGVKDFNQGVQENVSNPVFQKNEKYPQDIETARWQIVPEYVQAMSEMLRKYISENPDTAKLILNTTSNLKLMLAGELKMPINYVKYTGSSKPSEGNQCVEPAVNSKPKKKKKESYETKFPNEFKQAFFTRVSLIYLALKNSKERKLAKFEVCRFMSLNFRCCRADDDNWVVCIWNAITTFCNEDPDGVKLVDPDGVEVERYCLSDFYANMAIKTLKKIKRDERLNDVLENPAVWDEMIEGRVGMPLDDYEWPIRTPIRARKEFTYGILISLALTNSEDGRLTQPRIYRWITLYFLNTRDTLKYYFLYCLERTEWFRMIENPGHLPLYESRPGSEATLANVRTGMGSIVPIYSLMKTSHDMTRMIEGTFGMPSDGRLNPSTRGKPKKRWSEPTSSSVPPQKTKRRSYGPQAGLQFPESREEDQPSTSSYRGEDQPSTSRHSLPNSSNPYNLRKKKI